MHFFFAIWKRNRWNLPLFGEFSVVICIKTLGLKRSSPSIYRSYPEEDHNLVAPLSGDLMIFYYIALYFFFFVVLGGVQLHQPLIARGVVNTELPCTYSVRVFSLLRWPLARLTPDCCSNQVLDQEREALEQMRCLLSPSCCSPAVYAHSAVEYTMFI